jgi:hypothetical protein
MTCIRRGTGFFYPAAILDASSRKVVGYAILRDIDTQLMLAALRACDQQPPNSAAVSTMATAAVSTPATFTGRSSRARIARLHERCCNPYHNARRELHEDTQGRGSLYRWLRDIQGRYCTAAKFIEDVYNGRRPMATNRNFQPAGDVLRVTHAVPVLMISASFLHGRHAHSRGMMRLQYTERRRPQGVVALLMKISAAHIVAGVARCRAGFQALGEKARQ